MESPLPKEQGAFEPFQLPSYRLHKQSGQAVVTLRDAVTGRRRDILRAGKSTPASFRSGSRPVVPCRYQVPGATHLPVNELLAHFPACIDSERVVQGRGGICTPFGPPTSAAPAADNALPLA